LNAFSFQYDRESVARQDVFERVQNLVEPAGGHSTIGWIEGDPMTLTINLPDEQTAVLAAKARARGLSAEEYALRVIEHDLVPEWLQQSWASSGQAGLDRLSMDEIDADIAAARKARRESQSQPGS
jgi:hypothetical protein